MNTTTLIRETFSHMGQHSGYDLLCSALQAEGSSYHSIWLDDQLYKKIIKSKTTNFVLKILPNATPFYRPPNFWAELEACLKSFGSSNIIHILYGENNLGIYAIPIVKCRKKLVVTVHQPFSWWKGNRLNIQKKFHSTDALIVLSNVEKENFGKILGKDKLHFVPHGVDTEFFSPPNALQLEEKLNSTRKRCLFVGQWLRDFKTLFAVIEELVGKNNDIFFDLVVPDLSKTACDIEKRLIEFEDHPQVSRHKNINDANLLDLYRNASLLFLPLKDSTANNAILEAMACGVPIVTNSTSGIADYTEKSYAFVCPTKDADAMVAAILDITYNPNLQKTMAHAARKSAVEKFDWQLIASQIRKIYEKLS